MDFLDIGDVAARSGVKPSALRYYEEIGLISSVWRRGLRRQFGPEVLLQLRLIAMGKSAGFSLDEIAAMFGKNGELQMPRGMLHQRADDVDRQIHDLTMMRDTLRHVADCPAPSHLECPSFRRLVDAAGRTRPGEPERAKRRPPPS
jgi:DNA-binding transcriptional MerR regulator